MSTELDNGKTKPSGCTTGTYLERSKKKNAFFNRVIEDQEEIHPPTISEISNAQRSDKYLRKYFKPGGAKVPNSYELSIVDNIQVLTENGKMVTPESLRRRGVSWYHEYLQHPGATR